MKSKIYDCFMFYNEFELLEIRLNELWDKVDHFVLVEGTRTFTDKKKDPLFDSKKESFSDYLDKIIHIIVDDYPPYSGSPWDYEHHQRDSIKRGLCECQDDDIIIVSDIDEIPNPRAITANRRRATIYGMRVFYYKLNIEAIPPKKEMNIIRKRTGCSSAWYGSRSIFYKDYVSAQKLRSIKAKKSQFPRNLFRINPVIIGNGGWHFSYLMSDELILDKINAFSHQEFKEHGLGEIATIRQRINDLTAIDPGRINWKLSAIDIDDSMPKYIVEHKDKLKHLIEPTEQ